MAKEPMRNSHFRSMSFLFKIRDLLKNPIEKVKHGNLKPGYKVLDYGCGPGSHTIKAAEIVGANGIIYAADIHPLSALSVKKKAQKKGLSNIIPIITNCNIKIGSESVNVVFCFDAFHGIDNKECVLKEFNRVLKLNGILLLDDHHMTKEEIIKVVTSSELFEFKQESNKVFTFKKL